MEMHGIAKPTNLHDYICFSYVDN